MDESICLDVEDLSIRRRRRLRAAYGLSFVDSIAEIFGPLLQGFSVFLIPDDTVVDSPELVRELADRHVTRLVVVPLATRRDSGNLRGFRNPAAEPPVMLY